MKIKKVLNKAIDVLLTLLLIIMAIAIVWIVFFRTSKDAPKIFGLSIYVVATPSMEPEIAVGDIIINKAYKGEDLSVGQVITYHGKSGTYVGKLITHKIISVDNQTGEIQTQGVNNTAPDPIISKDDVEGVLVYKTVVLGKIYGFIMKPYGFIIIIILPMVLFTVKEVVSAIKEAKRASDEETQAELDEKARQWIKEREEREGQAEREERVEQAPQDGQGQ